MTGDGTITARVVGEFNGNSWTKAGVMIRETRNPSSSFAAVEVTPGNGVVYQARTSTGAMAVTTQGPTVASPYWVRVVRSGTTLTGYASPNGSSWTQIGTYTISMASQVDVGLALTSHANHALSTATFDNVTVSDGSGGGGSVRSHSVPIVWRSLFRRRRRSQRALRTVRRIVWSVDGVTGGNATVGLISSSGVYTPPANAGVHTVTVTSDDQTSSQSPPSQSPISAASLPITPMRHARDRTWTSTL